jgi:hypothetical protein
MSYTCTQLVLLVKDCGSIQSTITRLVIIPLFLFYTNKRYQTNMIIFLSVQERLTRQIAEAIEEAVQPHGVGVIVECVYVTKLNLPNEKKTCIFE